MPPAVRAAAFGAENNDENAAREGLWNNLHLPRVQPARRPLTDDSYLEWEFGGRKVLDLYGYIDYKNLFDDASSDVPDGENWFVDIELSPSTACSAATSPSARSANGSSPSTLLLRARQGPGLNVLWSGIGTNTELPWLGTVGLNLYARYIDKNYGASNENAWDGYVAHMNWFKPLAQFGGKRFIAFQGFFDYEFGSKLPDKDDAFEREYRTDNGFQAYLGLWYHTEHWKFGYGAKVYRNMTQWRDGETGRTPHRLQRDRPLLQRRLRVLSARPRRGKPAQGRRAIRSVSRSKNPWASPSLIHSTLAGCLRPPYQSATVWPKVMPSRLSTCVDPLAQQRGLEQVGDHRGVVHRAALQAVVLDVVLDVGVEDVGDGLAGSVAEVAQRRCARGW